MTLRLLVGPLAEDDLLDVWVYVASQSGSAARADGHVRRLHSVFEHLAAFPRLGRRCARWGEDVYAFADEAYLIVYRLRTDAIEVLRVSGGDQDLIDME